MCSEEAKGQGKGATLESLSKAKEQKGAAKRQINATQFGVILVWSKWMCVQVE